MHFALIERLNLRRGYKEQGKKTAIRSPSMLSHGTHYNPTASRASVHARIAVFARCIRAAHDMGRVWKSNRPVVKPVPSGIHSWRAIALEKVRVLDTFEILAATAIASRRSLSGAKRRCASRAVGPILLHWGPALRAHRRRHGRRGVHRLSHRNFSLPSGPRIMVNRFIVVWDEDPCRSLVTG